jgi:hypothetical protein
VFGDINGKQQGIHDLYTLSIRESHVRVAWTTGSMWMFGILQQGQILRGEMKFGGVTWGPENLP